MTDNSIGLDTVPNAAEYSDKQAREIELEIERMGVVLDIDWSDETQVRELAKEALEHAQETLAAYEHDHSDYRLKTKITLFALANLMLDIMAKSADKGIHTHGGVAWKAFSKALMKECGIPIKNSDEKSG
jgi:hypothetical protein